MHKLVHLLARFGIEYKRLNLFKSNVFHLRTFLELLFAVKFPLKFLFLYKISALIAINMNEMKKQQFLSAHMFLVSHLRLRRTLA